MATNTIADNVNTTLLNEADLNAQGQMDGLKDQGKFTRESQDAQTKSSMSSVSTENTKTSQNSQINSSKGVQY